ncbi:MAG: hypothetical protein Q7T74_04070 [Candidatus Saccharibacteria bacterium]|nr:hypothetical protein [Candidatus Saccharibacteria bacterium]
MSDFELPTINNEQDAKDLEAKYGKKELILPNQRAIDEFGGKKDTSYSKYEPGEHTKDDSDASYDSLEKQVKGKESLSDIAKTAIEGIQKQLATLRSALEHENKSPSVNKKIKPDLEAKIAKLENDLKQFGVVSAAEISDTSENSLLENVDKLVDSVVIKETTTPEANDLEQDDGEIVIKSAPAIPPTNPDEAIEKAETEAAAAEAKTAIAPVPTDPAEKKKWYKKYGKRILAGVAIGAAFAAGWFAHSGNKDNHSHGAEKPAPMEKAPGFHKSDEKPGDKISRNLKFNQGNSAYNHRGNKVNTWGTERSLLVENAPNGELKGEALNEYIGNHDKITAANVEKLVNVRFQEMYGLDAAKFNSAWGQGEREKMKRKYLSDSGHSLSDAGQKAHDIHQNILRSGKTLKMTAAEAAEKYDLDVNSYMKEGKLKGGIDDTAYAIGNTHGEIYVTFDKDGNIKHAENGECANEAFFIKGSFTPENPTPNTPPPTTETPPPVTKTPPNEKKGKVYIDDHGPADNGDVRAEKGKKEAQQQAGGQTDAQAEQQANSNGNADGATDVDKPNDAAQDEASNQTSNGNVGE